MNRSHKILAAFWLFLAILSGGFYLLRPNKSAVDWVISHISAPLRESIGALSDLLPFSMAEVFYTAIILTAIILIVKMIQAVRKSQHKWKTLGIRLAALMLIPAFIITGYNWLWALGYYGTTFAERSGLKNQGVSVEDLTKVTAYFAEQASDLSVKMERDGEGHFIERGFWQDYEGLYDNLEAEFPFLKTKALRPKPMLYSKFMSLIGFTGFYFPFTGEANVNTDFPPALQPETISHELAHQRRVASEAEANFVGIAAAISSDKPVYQYSAYLSGLTHLSNALYKADREAWAAISETLAPEIRIDWNDNSRYWAQFESPVETVATTVYDSYLKHNDQELGIKSYGACVDLLVEYYKNKI